MHLQNQTLTCKKMKKVLFIASLLLAFVAQTDAKAKKALTEKDMGAYLFT